MTELSDCIVTTSPSLQNRALNYGDGCFSTMLSRKGKVELLDYHVQRLISDAKKLCILHAAMTLSDEHLRKVIYEFAKDAYSAGSTTEWQIIKLLIIRGDSERGYAPDQSSAPLLVPSVQDYSMPVKQALHVRVAHMVLSEQTVLAGIKHINRLEQVMAKLELANYVDIDDLVLTNAKGMMLELSSSNLFYRIDGLWHTPCLKKSGVNGVMRQYILNYMKHRNIPCVVSEMNVSNLAQTEAAFSCNAVTKIKPIAKITMSAQTIQLNTQVSQQFADTISHQVMEGK